MISILIPTKRSEALRECLKSIKVNTTRKYEVILLDYKAGYNRKLNDGYRKSKGDYIAILHDDCEVKNGWLDHLSTLGAFKYHEKGNILHGGMFDGQFCYDWYPDYASFLLISKKVADMIFPLDEFYKNPWCADCDLGQKIKSLGLSIEPLKGEVIHHHLEGAGVAVPENEKYYKEKWRIT